MPVFRLTDDLIFPPVHFAEEDGLLAVGGDLSSERLMHAYRNGIFPWFNEEDPILWWSPNPRCVLFPHEVMVSKSMRKILRDNEFKITFDTCFEDVIANCKITERPNQEGTWISTDVIESYCSLFEKNLAHSVEVWKGEELVGGLYGISIGKCFFGESMFSKVSNASKAGFISLVLHLQQWDFQIIDCQVHTPHLESLGARMIDRNEFLDHLQIGMCTKEDHKKKWKFKPIILSSFFEKLS